jgi:uncharacterized membrane protein
MVYFYRMAGTVRTAEKSCGDLKRLQMISLLLFGVSLLIPLARISPIAGLSVGHIAAALVL